MLVVDDDEDVREALADLLVQEGYAVLTASDGAEALDLLAASVPAPDLILLDLRMPRRSGWEVLAALRESPLLAQTPVVVVSVEAARMPFGAMAWLDKPVDRRALLSAIETHIAPLAAEVC